MTALIQIILGGVLLLAGRRLYWLLAAGAGFVLGWVVAQSLLQDQPDTVVLIVSLVAAVVFAVLAVIGQRFIIGVVGFVAGGVGLLRLLEAFNLGPAEANTLLTLVVFVVGGILGAILLVSLFGLGLVVLSSLIGAEILLIGLRQLVEVPEPVGTIVLVALIALGIVVQIGLFRKA